MRRLNRIAVILGAWIIAAVVAPAMALPSATLGLGEPRVSPTGAEIDILASFTPEDQSQQGAVFVSLLLDDENNVLKDDPAVFEFSPANLVQDWNLFKDLANPGSFLLDTFDPDMAFSGGPEILGTIVIDFELAMTAPGEEVVIALNDQDSSIGFEDPPGDNPTFDFAELGLDPPRRSFIVPGRPQRSIPEPAMVVLGVMALGAASLASHRRR